MSIQQRIKAYIKSMKAREEVLISYWNQEQAKMLIQLVKMKNKTKKQKDFMQKLRDLKDIVW